MAEAPGWQGSEAQARAKGWYSRDLESLRRWIWVWWVFLAVWIAILVREVATDKSYWLSIIFIALSVSWLVRFYYWRSKQTGGSISHSENHN
jgi:hypothetical protein